LSAPGRIGDTRIARRIEKLLIAAGPVPFLPPPGIGPDFSPSGPEALGMLIGVLGLNEIMNGIAAGDEA